jgi:hypothetical protein
MGALIFRTLLATTSLQRTVFRGLSSHHRQQFEHLDNCEDEHSDRMHCCSLLNMAD